MKYKLFDLKITTIGDKGTFNCSHIVGDGFFVCGEQIQFFEYTKQFSHYALATLLPYLAAKQRADDVNDWMYYESLIACPDPQCGALFSIERTERAEYEYGEE
jgi:uncharacterized repeat protein (TIGR04076 family)